MFRCRSLAVALTALALAVMGCAGGTGSPKTTDPAAWVNDVCGALLPLVEANKAPPKVVLDFAATKQSVIAALTPALEAVSQATGGLDAAGPAPIPGGDEAVGRLRELAGQLGTSLGEAKAKLQAANPNDAAGFVTALRESLDGLRAATTIAFEAQKAFDPSGEVKAAARQAPKCQQLGVGVDPSVSPGPSSTTSATPGPPTTGR